MENMILGFRGFQEICRYKFMHQGRSSGELSKFGVGLMPYCKHEENVRVEGKGCDAKYYARQCCVANCPFYQKKSSNPWIGFDEDGK